MIKRFVIKRMHPFLMYFFSKANDYITEVQAQKLLNGLKSRGKDIYLQMPIYASSPQNIEIGNNVSLAAFIHLWGEGGIKIGNRVMIGSHTAITSAGHDYRQSDMYTTHVLAPVIVEDNVWIGTHAIILPGVKIGKGAVIGAGAVVLHDVAPNSIVMGIPANHYKYREIQDNT